jgi:hypothetical protein
VEIIASNVSQPIYVKHTHYTIFALELSIPKIWASFCNFLKTVQSELSLIGKNTPNLVTLFGIDIETWYPFQSQVPPESGLPGGARQVGGKGHLHSSRVAKVGHGRSPGCVSLRKHVPRVQGNNYSQPREPETP